MQTTLTIIRYKTWAIPLAFIAMIIFRIPLYLNKNIVFFKLMGSGKNGTFDKIPDLHQWAILATHKSSVNNYTFNLYKPYGIFIMKWLHFFSSEFYTLLLEPISGHGTWDNKAVFANSTSKIITEGQIATLTRATIKFSKLGHFWKNVAPIAAKMNTAKGLIFSVGIGEVPWIKQATFSIWDSVEDLKNFAYNMKEHSEVVKKTKEQKWYSEDMFYRFNIIDSFGSLHGNNPLKRKR